MKAFVTGGTGLLGSNLVYQLLEQGYEVKVLVRSPEKAGQQFGDLPIHYVQGDMEKVADFAHEMAGVDVLFHTAAYFREYYGLGEHWAMLEKINVQGTLELLTQAEKQGVKKTIYVSSSGVIGLASDGSAGDENTPADKAAMENLYFRSKVMAEEKIGEWLKSHTMSVILILPTAIFGPRDAGPTASGQLLLDFLHGKLPAIPPGGFSTVDARDVAAAMIAAVEKGRNGERYIITHRYHSVEEILTILSELTGHAKPAFKMPVFVALAFAYLSEFLSRITGQDPVATVNAIQTLASRREVIGAKAERELGIKPRPLELSLYDELHWYLENGYIQIPLHLKTVSI
jgi:dihydroflavonol-4-reductase